MTPPDFIHESKEVASIQNCLVKAMKDANVKPSIINIFKNLNIKTNHLIDKIYNYIEESKEE